MKRARLILIAAAFAAAATLVECSDQSMPTAPTSSAIAEATSSNDMTTNPNMESSFVPTPGYTFYMGGEVLCQDQTHECPDISEAPSGDVFVITGKGTFSTSNTTTSMISGQGTYEERDMTGKKVSDGTWKAERLYSFVTYGPVLKDNVLDGQYGGQMEASVRLSGIPGEVIVRVTDAQGTSVPMTAMTGVTVKDPSEEFGKPVNGMTAFVPQSALIEQASNLPAAK
jgi:hypothetical protein